jgi:HEAT repeats
MTTGALWRIGAVIFVVSALPLVAHARPAESKRMERAKDLIADEQWVRAIDDLKAAADDPKEPNKAEALFWLAHSQNQARDTAAAVETIRRLERQFPASPWVKPAQSLRIEIAQRLQRKDFLWYTAVPPTPPAPAMAPAVPPAPTAVTPAALPLPVPPSKPTPPPAAPKGPAGVGPKAPPTPAPAAFRAFPAMPAWAPDGYFPDMDQRIQALARLMRTDAVTVIPILKSIALESTDVGEGRRALLVLAQSDRPEARETVIDVAKSGPEPVRLVAVRELGRLKGPTIVEDLMEVYATGNENVRYQVVTSLAQPDAAPALYKIAKSEKDRRVRDVAIVRLGDAGGRLELSKLYVKAPADIKRPIILGLFNAQADEELIQIAEMEKDPVARAEILARLRLLGTPKAKAYLADHR